MDNYKNLNSFNTLNNINNTSNESNDLNNLNQNDLYQQSIIQTTGDKPRTLHVAHRRSPSELTTLMRMYFLTLLSQFFKTLY